jgi:integrase
MAIFKRARGECPSCGREGSARVTDKRKAAVLTCAGCGGSFELPVDSAWWVSYRDPQGRPRVKRIGPSLDLAKEADAALLADLIRGELNIERKGSSLTLTEALDRYLDAVEPTIKHSAFKTRRQILRHTVAGIGPTVQIALLDDTTIEAYRQKRTRDKMKPGTIATELAWLRAFLSWCVRMKLARTRPQISTPAPDNGRLRFLARDEAARLLEAARKVPGFGAVLADYLEILIFTGLRRAEGLGLRWEWVDLQRRTITLPSEASKNGHFRVIPLAAEAVAALERRRGAAVAGCPFVFADQGERLTDSRLSRVFVTARKAAELGLDVTIHTCRHTCASWLTMAGAGLLEVAQILGHRTLEVTRRYSHLSPDHLRSTIERISLTPTPTPPAEPAPKAEEKAGFGDPQLTGKNLIRFPFERTGA